MSHSLTIKLLGGLVFEIDGRPVSGLVTQKAEVLVAYLACHRQFPELLNKPRPHSRELLATMLWDDRTQKQALSNLRTVLTSLRRHLKPYLNITRQTVGLNEKADVWVDATAFEEAVASSAQQGEIRAEDSTRLEEALALYRGDFLEGVFVSESRAMERWMAQTRERLLRRAIDARRRLATYYLHHHQYHEALPHARELVRADRLDEQGHRLLMRLLARDGQTGATLAQFERCREILAEELNLAPDPQTIRLRDQIERIRHPIPHRLPTQFTPFVGRREELATASRLLEEEICRLLTILGVGGAGKTRLAIEMADERRGDYWHGIVFIPLAGVADTDGLVQAIASALEVNLKPQNPLEEQLLAHLRERELLLVLDNFEQLVTKGLDLIQTILKEAPDVQLLVTSRERLQLRAEWLLTLKGLDLSTPQGNGTPVAQPSSDAETLFEISARRMQSTFRLTEGQVKDVRHICELVDGLPLAIELAAGSLPAHTPQAVANHIQENLDFLSTTMRDVPERQRSLRATFDYSWSLLDGEAQDILAQLAVFRGEFDAAAAQAVTQADASNLDALCARSLLQQTGEERYALHDALWQYALEKLENDKAMSGLANIAFRQGRYEDAKARYAQSLDLSRQLEQPSRIAASLEGLAIVANFQGDLQEALRLLRQSLELHREVDDRHALANALGNLAATLMDLGHYTQSLPYFEESIAIWRRLGDDYTLRIVLWNMGEAKLKLDRLQEAQAIFSEALQISEREGYPTGYAYWGLGKVHFLQEDYEQARNCTRRALAESSSDYERLRALFLWAQLEAQAGRRVQAATLLRLICDHPTTTALDREEAQEALEKVRVQMAMDDDAARENRAGSAEVAPSLDAVIGAILSES